MCRLIMFSLVICSAQSYECRKYFERKFETMEDITKFVLYTRANILLKRDNRAL